MLSTRGGRIAGGVYIVGVAGPHTFNEGGDGVENVFIIDKLIFSIALLLRPRRLILLCHLRPVVPGHR